MLGDTMSEPAQRASRSRYNSPFAAPPSNAIPNSSRIMADVVEKPRMFLDGWLEPPIATPRPSFAEAGIERHGVLQNMAPLGTRPSAKMLKATARPELMDPSGRGNVVKKSGVSTPSEAITTPEPSANPLRHRSLSAKPEIETETVQQQPQTPQMQTSQPPTPQQTEQPQPQSSAKKISLPPRPRESTAGQIAGQGVFSLQSPIQANPPRQYQPSVPPPSQFGPNGEYTMDLKLTDKVVELAVEQAVYERRYPTAYALRMIYDKFRQNPRMVRLIDTICHGRATEDQNREFKNVMRVKKKEGKKDDTGKYYFDTGDSMDTPPPKQPNFSAVNSKKPSFSTPSGMSATGARTLSDAQARRSSINLSSALNSPLKEVDGHISKKHKSNNFPTPSSLEMNGNASASTGGAAKASHPSASKANGTPKKGRPRSDSNSSSSSLSSLDEKILSNDYADADADDTSPVSQQAEEALGPDGGADAHTQAQSRRAPVNANSLSQAAETDPSLRNSTQPINAQHRIGPKTYTFSTVTTSSPSSAALPSTNNSTGARQYNSHLRQPSASSSDAMAPAALLPESIPHHKTSKQSKKELVKAVSRAFDEDDPRVKLKRKARDITNKAATAASESFERHQIPLLPEFETNSDGGDSVAAPSKRTNIRLINNKKTTRQSQAQTQSVNYDSDTLSSPTVLSFHPDLAPGSLSVSRAGTPSQFNRPTRKAKAGTGLRVKTSPMKKKGGTLAGIPRASGEGKSPTGNGALSHSQDDNDDYCSSCGGNGDLVCCDGCTRSFHFKCVDPPINQDAMPDEWFCNVCLNSRVPRRHEDEIGVFGGLLANLNRKNPSAFHLPKDIREYFIDVKTGAEGEYEEPVPPKAKNRAGWDEAPDYFRLKDNKGKTILCHQCHGAASAPDRAIIPCTYCGLSWHLDCLDVPMAKEPGPGKPWKCPAHVDDLLTVIPAALAPAHRFRRIKGQSAIRPVISRGIRNNGHIEIENDPTDDEEELGFYEQREYGHVYKLPEMGIKLDFISQVREKTGGLGGFISPRASYSHSHFEQSRPAPPAVSFDQRKLVEQEAALNLASLCIPKEVGDPKPLIDALIAGASPAVVALVAQGSASNIASNNVESKADRDALLAMKAYIDAKVAALPIETPVEETPSEKTPVDGFEVVTGEAVEKTGEQTTQPMIVNGVEDVEMSG